jgi:hypothetical protein
MCRLMYVRLSEVYPVRIPSLHITFIVSVLDLEDAKRALDASRSRIGLIRRIVGLEDIQLVGITSERSLETRDGSLLLCYAGNRCAFGRAGLGPAGLSDDDFLAVGSGYEAVVFVFHPLTCLRCAGLRIEEGVGVGCAVVGSSAESRVGEMLVECIDGDDISVIASGPKLRSACVDCCSDRIRIAAAVDDFIADVNSVDCTPVATNLLNESPEVGCDIVDQIDADDGLHAVVSSSCDKFAYIAADVVRANHAVPLALDEAKFLIHLIQTSARPSSGHKIVADSISSTRA